MPPSGQVPASIDDTMQNIVLQYVDNVKNNSYIKGEI